MVQGLRANVGAYQPFLDTATGMATQAGRTSPLGAAAGAIGEASQRFPSAVEQYMDPYIQNVLNRQAELSGRQLTEEFLPQLQDAFTGSGQFGSERMLEMGQRGVRDISEALQGQQLAALSGAYGQAGELFGADQARIAGLAPVIGNLATAGAELGLGGSQQLGALGEFASVQGLRDAAAMEAVGGQRQTMGQESLNLAYADHLRQQGYPREMIDWMSTVVRGLPTQQITTSTDVGPAANYQPSPLSQLASGYGVYKGITGNKGAKGGLIQAQEGFKLKEKSPQFMPRYTSEAHYA